MDKQQKDSKQKFDYENAKKTEGYDRLSLQKRTDHEQRRDDTFSLGVCLRRLKDDWIGKKAAFCKGKNIRTIKRK